jgi:acyl carrier protein
MAQGVFISVTDCFNQFLWPRFPAAPARGETCEPIGHLQGVIVETKALDHTELANQIIEVIVKEGMVDREKATLDATIESLDLKSIDIVMILTAIEEKFDVYIPMDGPFHEAKNIGDLIDAIAAYIIKEKN